MTPDRDGPMSDFDIANGAYLQYVETGDECYIANMKPDEMRAFIRVMGDTDRIHNAGRRCKAPGWHVDRPSCDLAAGHDGPHDWQR